MSTFYIIVVVFTMIIILGFDFYVKRQRKTFINKLVNLLVNKDFNDFYDLLNSKQAKTLLSLFDLKLLEFNAATLDQKEEKANKVFESLQNKKMTGYQTIEFYGKALIYFIEKKDAMHAKECYAKIDEIKGYQKDKKYLLTLYKIMILNDISDEELVEKRLAFDSKQEKIMDYYLLARINELKKDFIKVKKYNQLADKIITKIVE